MKRFIVNLLLSFAFAVNAFAQHKNIQKVTDSIVNEGKALYRSEWASWYGSDIFLDKCKDKSSLIGGYISYETKEGLTNMFFSKGENPVVLATTSFGNDFNANNYKLDTIPRKLTDYEKDLIAIRQIAIKRMNTDTVFKYFNNANLNPVPIIKNGVKTVYVLTGPKENGVVIFGNDYMISFNNNNEITHVKKLHKNIIPIQYNKTDVSAMHAHLPETGDFITAIDICTLMLYEKFTTWNQYYVISKNYVSIWDCKKDILAVITMEAWKRIAASDTSKPSKQ